MASSLTWRHVSKRCPCKRSTPNEPNSVNAVIEGFFLNLKMERVWQKDYANQSEAMTDVAEYIVGFYNCERLHSKLGNLSPNAFKLESATQQPIDVSEIT